MTEIIPPVEVLQSRRSELLFDRFEFGVFTTKKITPEDSELWLAMGHLRAREYLKRHYISPEDLNEDGAEYDEYDDRADHFVAVADDGRVIGTVRVIHRTEAGLLLPGEEEFDHRLPEDTREISRLIRDSSLNHTEGFLVSLSMMRAALKATKGVSERVCAVLEERLYRQLNEHIGIKLTTVGEPKTIEHYNNTFNYLVTMTPSLITSQVHERDERMYYEALKRPVLAENIISQPFAPFFERNSTTKGLGRVSLSDLVTPNPEQFERNRGFYSQEEQEKLWNSTVAIAGVGGDGGQLAITLAQAGVTNFYLADPEVFSVENLNRQAGADYSTIGHNKAEVIARQLRALGARTKVYTEGVTAENIDEFVGSSDLVIDETEFTMPHIGVMIARAARSFNLPVLMALNVGFGSYTTSFSPKGIPFETYLGINPALTLREIEEQMREQQIPIGKWAPHIPSYANVNILKKVADGEMSAPSVAQGVQMAAADAGTQAIAHLLKDINPDWEKWITWAPKGRSLDARDGEIKVRSRSMHFTRSVAIAALKTRLRMSHPKQN